MEKIRLDVLLVDRGLLNSRTLAQRLVMAGNVRVNGQLVFKPSTKVTTDAELVIDRGPAYVSRGGDKLSAALNYFNIDVVDMVCADVGASTGGFTDCLLQNGAEKVYAIDVGHGILHWKLRQDPRVVVMERTNARYMSTLPEPIDIVTVDASFISLSILLPVIKNWFDIREPIKTQTDLQYGQVIALIKPQFEAGRQIVSKGAGVVKDPKVHHTVLSEILNFAISDGYQVNGLLRSPLLGPKGNVEFLGWFRYPVSEQLDIQPMVELALADGTSSNNLDTSNKPA